MYRQATPRGSTSRKSPGGISPSTNEMTLRAIAELVASGQATRARKAGEPVPSFALKKIDGNIVRLKNLLVNGPLIITFCRGAWCPHCNRELKALQAAKGEFDRYGTSLVAISPQTVANNRKWARQNKIEFPVLFDAKGRVSAAFGVRFNLPRYLIELYKGMKIDLPSFNDNPRWSLPMAARYVIDQDGIILYSEVKPDHTCHSDPEELMPVVQREVADKASRLTELRSYDR
jgi:peroxiredoxin